MENQKKVNKKLNLYGKVKDYLIKKNAKIYLINVQINLQKLFGKSKNKQREIFSSRFWVYALFINGPNPASFCLFSSLPHDILFNSLIVQSCMEGI